MAGRTKAGPGLVEKAVAEAAKAMKRMERNMVEIFVCLVIWFGLEKISFGICESFGKFPIFEMTRLMSPRSFERHRNKTKRPSGVSRA